MNALRLQRDQVLVEPPPFMHARIMGSIHSVGIGSRRPRNAFKWAISLTLSTQLLLVLVILRNQEGPKPHSSPSPTARMVSREPVATRNSDSRSVASLVELNKLQQLTTVFDERLEHELNFVVHDARTALHGLANSFLPEKFRESALGATQN